jgi:cytochrome c553
MLSSAPRPARTEPIAYSRFGVFIGSPLAIAIALGMAYGAGIGFAQQTEPPAEPTPVEAAPIDSAAVEAAAVEAAGWVEAVGKSAEALRLQGNVGDGERAFEVCSHCHLPSGAGRVDGRIPQLAGQHRSVVIKQLVDIREGRRENPIMEPFARTIVDPQLLADVAIYLETLPIPRDNGRGSGANLEVGGMLYQQNCSPCHGGEGEGNSAAFIPVLAGQHYEYTLRQLREIAALERKNIHPGMRAVIQGYTSEQRAAIADYVSRLEWPERQQN